MSALVLVTRPIEQAKDFAAAIEKMGARPLISPLTEIEYLPLDLSEISMPDAPDAIVLTSAQAVSGCQFPVTWQDIPVFCVGEATAQSARLAGLQNCLSGEGQISTLLPVIRSRLSAMSHILYLRGEYVAHDLSQVLPDYVVQSVTTYIAREVPDFLSEISANFANIHTITLFSPRTGAILKALMEKHCFSALAAQINILCLSPSVLESVGELPWKTRVVAKEPTRQSMIDSLDMLLKK